MPDTTFSAEGVKKQLLKINIDKGSGPHLIQARILSDVASELTVVLSSLFSYSTIRELCHMAVSLPIFVPSLKRAPKLQS